MMVSDEEIEWAIQIMENPKAPWTHKWLASEIVDVFIQQEDRTFAWMQQCYLGINLARMAAQRYGNRTRAS